MIPEMITSAYLSFGTRGFSETAEFIVGRISQSQSELEKPDFYFSLKKRLLPYLKEVYGETTKVAWDGYNAQPIPSDIYYCAVAFLSALPNTIQEPSIGAEPDGHLTFEWYRSTQRLLSVSVGMHGNLHYAALLGPNKSYGTEVFNGTIPQTIVDLIRRVYAA